MTHEVETTKPFFERVLNGQKKFELRIDDRDYQIGDELVQLEYDQHTKEFSGRRLSSTITYKISGGQWGVERGWCVLGLGEVTQV